MARRLGWSMLVALVVGAAAQGAAPPIAKARLLSLREAQALAVEQAGRAAGVGRDVDDPEPPARCAVQRCCAEGKLTQEQRRSLQQNLLNVEVAYWNLYGSYWTLYSREQGLRFAFEAFKLNKARYEAGRATAADYFQSRGQYELFRAQRLQAIDTVLENERQLRALMGMPVSDGARLMPSDSPTLAPYLPDWEQAMAEALARRPELFLARQEVKASQMNLLFTKNQLLPDLCFGSSFAHAQVCQAQLALARSLETLKDQERKTASFMSVQYRRLSTAYEQIRANRAQREAFGEQLRARQQEFLAGRGTLDTLLEAQRFWADALANEFQQIVAYNNALAGFDFARGLSLHRAHLVGAKTPLLSADGERKRAASASAPALTAWALYSGDCLPKDAKTAPSLASLWEDAPGDLAARLSK